MTLGESAETVAALEEPPAVPSKPVSKSSKFTVRMDI
jgi:hypothetical protein